MKTNNCLRIRVLTRNACLHLMHVSSPGACSVLNWRMRPQLAYVSSHGEYVVVSNRRVSFIEPPSSAHKKSCAHHPGFKSIKSLDGDRGMDRCHYAVPFKGISIRSIPEIVQESEDERPAMLDDKLLYGMNSLAF